MTTQTTPAEGIPDFLKRTPAPQAEAGSAAIKDALKAASADAAAGAKAKAEKKTKAAKPAKVAAPKAEKKAKAAKPAHKPSTIASTPDNPAKSIVPVRFKQAYAAHNDTCGRPLNVALKEATTTKNDDGRDCLDVPALRAIAKENGIDFKPYEGLNNGQKRMNVGNKLAGLIKAGTTVTIGKRKFANAEKALAKPAPEQAAA